MLVAGWIAVVLLAVTWAFQVGLALGAPWGAAAWGGQHPGRLPSRLRIASGVAAVLLYPAILLLVLDTSTVADLGLVEGGAAQVLMWVIAGFFGLGTLANAASRSPAERGWAPVALGVAICATCRGA